MITAGHIHTLYTIKMRKSYCFTPSIRANRGIVVNTRLPTLEKSGRVLPLLSCFTPSSEFIHGDLWRSFIVLDRGALEHLGNISNTDQSK